MTLIAAFAIALLTSTLLVPLLMRYAGGLGLIDLPTEARKVHVKAIPRCGGIGIATGVLLAAFFWLELSPQILSLLGALLVIVVFGIIDDRQNLSYHWKFAGQLLATIILLCGGTLIERVPFMGMDPIPVWLSWPLTLFFVMGVTNAVNLSDGLDGLAAGNSLLSLVLITILSLQIGETHSAILAVAGIGGLLGFLRYNTHPATVFMGDTGSQFLGFLTVSLAILCTQSESAPFSPLLPVLIIGLPILDTFMVMTIRIWEGRFIFSPDRNHIHHQLLELNFRHYEVVAILYLLCTLLAVIAWSLRFSSDLLVLVSYLLYCAALIGVLYRLRIQHWHFRTHQPQANSRDRRSQWIRKIDWYHYRVGLVLEVALSLFFVIAAVFLRPTNAEGIGFALLFVAGLIVLCVLLRSVPALATRIVVYTASAFIVFSFIHSLDTRPLFNQLTDAYLLVLFFLLMLGVRMTKKEVFRFDTHDYLVLLLLIMVPLFMEPLLAREDLTRLVLRFALLVYICEFLLGRCREGYTLLRTACLLSILILGFNHSATGLS
jgi:UDP-GlcNAc:undecaprenyl-phosphate GlcNAc-1-phosphate transferase